MGIVFHLTKCSPTSMVASCRIAKFISEQLGIELIHTPDQIGAVMRKVNDLGLDKFILVNSPTGFADQSMREACAELSHLAEDPIFVQNDYKMKPPSQCKSFNLKKHGTYKGESSDYYGMRLWSTVPDIKTTTQVDYINWNMLTYCIPNKILKDHDDRKGGIFYWGALRKGREQRLADLLQGDFKTTISTAPQSVKKFQKYLPDVNYIPQLKNLSEDLSNYRATLYTQDEISDTIYCSLANRFYEALSSKVAILIDESSVGTFETAGLLGFEQFVVRNPEDVEFMLGFSEEIAMQQNRLWAKDYKGMLETKLENIYYDDF